MKTPEQLTKDGGSYVTIKDDKILEYWISGDKNGIPMLLFPGFSQTGKLYSCKYFSDIFESFGIKCISVTLPGFAYSSNYVRTIGGWGKELEVLLQHEKIDQFYCVGYSFGGAHAASVASYYGKRILGVAIIASQWDQKNGPKEISMPSGLKALSYLRGSPWFLNGLFWTTLKIMSLFDVKAIYESQSDFKALPQEIQDASIQDVYRTIDCNEGMTRSFVDITTNEWDIDFGRINECQRVILGRGKEDDISPKQVNDWYAKSIPKAEFWEPEGKHMAFLMKIKDLLTMLIGSNKDSKEMVKTEETPKTEEANEQET